MQLLDLNAEEVKLTTAAVLTTLRLLFFFFTFLWVFFFAEREGPFFIPPDDAGPDRFTDLPGPGAASL